MGPAGSGAEKHGNIKSIQRCEEVLKKQLARLYLAEFADTETIDRGLSMDDRRALNLVGTPTTLSEGHFVLLLSLRVEGGVRRVNFGMAIKQLASLNQWLISDQSLADRYVAAMNQNIDEGCFTLVPKPHISTKAVPDNQTAKTGYAAYPY